MHLFRCFSRGSSVARAALFGLVALTIALPLGARVSPWEEAVYYEIFVPSFADAATGPLANDGVGDLDGLTARLDYLKPAPDALGIGLGVDVLVLMPIFPAEDMRGLAVTDFRGVRRDFGTMEDMRELVAAAHARDLRVVLDWPLNATSRRHPWFVAAQAGELPYADFYRFTSGESLGDPGYHASVSMERPDLVVTHPAVEEALLDVARFWLNDVGVDGFRLLEAPYLVTEGGEVPHGSNTQAWLARFREGLQEIAPGVLLAGQFDSNYPTTWSYLTSGALDLATYPGWSRELNKAVINGRSTELSQLYRNELARRETGPLLRPWTVGTFRAGQAMFGNNAEIRQWITLQLLTPGIPLLRYGDEMGMGGTGKPEPYEALRPMAWDASEHSGFSSVEPWVGLPSDASVRNVASLQAEGDSVWHWARKIIALRRDYEILRQVQACYPVGVIGQRCAGFAAVGEDGSRMIVLSNLGRRAQTRYVLNLEAAPWADESRPPVELLHGAVVTNPPDFDAQGAIRHWQPLDELADHTTYVLYWPPAEEDEAPSTGEAD